MPNILCLVDSQPFHVRPCRSRFQRCGQSCLRGQQLFASKSSGGWWEGARPPPAPLLVGTKADGFRGVTLLFTALGFSKIVAGSCVGFR